MPSLYPGMLVLPSLYKAASLVLIKTHLFHFYKSPAGLGCPLLRTINTVSKKNLKNKNNKNKKPEELCNRQNDSPFKILNMN